MKLMRAHKGRVTVGERTYIQSNSNLVAGRKSTIMIGENCKLAHNVTIRALSHSPDNPDLSIGRDVIVGDNFWIGANAVIREGVIVGGDSVIGAYAVGTKNVESNTIVGGIPAKLIRRKNTI
ncbi:MAG: acyltransferase [Candidatus Bathyarchaeota archaeon]|nr:acyltransferase [Candidatus Bathyarchaeota archaeon]